MSGRGRSTSLAGQPLLPSPSTTPHQRRPSYGDEAHSPLPTINDEFGGMAADLLLNYPVYNDSELTRLASSSSNRREGDTGPPSKNTYYSNGSGGNSNQMMINTSFPNDSSRDPEWATTRLPGSLRPSFINHPSNTNGTHMSASSFSTIGAGSVIDASSRALPRNYGGHRRPSADTDGLAYAPSLSPHDADDRRPSDATENEYDQHGYLVSSGNYTSSNTTIGLLNGRRNTESSMLDTDFMLEQEPMMHEGTPRIVLNTAERRSGVDGLLRGESYSVKQPARVVYYTSHGSRVNFYLQKDESTIGRKEDNTIVLSDAKISKYHASIKKTDIAFFIRDRNSSNGVRVNGTLLDPTKPTLLVHGDVINIGMCVLTFYDIPERAAHKPEPDLPLFAFDSLSRATVGRRQQHPLKSQSLAELVTILPSDNKFYENKFMIREEVQMETSSSLDFAPAANIDDAAMLAEDYEKLRLTYELSKVSVTEDITELLERSLELIFQILMVDRGVILLVDRATGILATHLVKLRPGSDPDVREIMLSSTILKKVLQSRIALITSDATRDPNLERSASVRQGSIRSVICMPLIAHNKIHGILHLDAIDKINYFNNKDLSLVKAICNQTAVAIENGILVKEVQNKARLTENLSRFLSPHVVLKMTEKDGIHAIRRGGGRETMGTIVFVDIRGFTNMSEKSPAADVVELLNEYFERLVKVVFNYDGVVDKYIGDALMATFGTLQGETDAEFRAVCAALDFRRQIAELNMERKRQNKQPIVIGVGVNTGSCLAGFIGCSSRLEYTVIGDSVNTSSRICSMAGENQVLIAESTYESVKNRVESRFLGKKKLKGKIHDVGVYEVITARAGLQTQVSWK
ncbi:hypothetical protein SmJEL517_g04037 [Synchytrium microbalum]|uniref:Adenylate cyclase n=1 Tax=Synchytrium microbalum TaxID=1806994 RepID=A0A507C0U3_9FUNG|nr:uncharacterized protein SmJEL517_g04037 [Synchytrium microbalum]TPX32988.1 hypothetical protein SmJEL517_g04037 [Synchytrium microbalum]